MEPRDVHELVEFALERAIESLDVIATDKRLDQELRETQNICNHALFELRGYGHEVEKEEWQNHDSE